MPSKARSPQPWGEGVGGVSGRPTRGTRRSNPLTCPGRNGGRHPDARDAVTLRGLAEKRVSWSVRRVCSGARSHAGGRTDDSGCPLEERGGERRRRAPSARTHRGGAYKAPPRTRTRPSLGPETRARQSSLNSLGIGASRTAEGGGATALVSRSGKPTQVGVNRHRDLVRWTTARLAACHRFSG